MLVTGTRAQTILAADHTGVLAGALASHATVLTTTDAATTLDVAREARPAAIVLHGDLPPEGGVSLAGRLAPLQLPLVLALSHPDDGTIGAALRVGVRSVVGLGDRDECLARAIEAACRQELFLAPLAIDRLRALVTGEPAERAPFPQLSPREHEVLAELGTGADVARIAARLGLSPKTVRNHLDRIRTKLGVGDSAQAALLARTAGITARRRAAAPGGLPG